MINNEVIEKAELLADAIAQSSERAELIRWEEAITADESTHHLMVQWQEAHEQLMEKQQNRIELSKAEQFELMRIENGIKNNPILMAYIIAQDKFQEMMQSVHDIISDAITGSSSSCSCEDGSCEPGECSGCS